MGAPSTVERPFVRWPAEERVRLGVAVADLAAAAGVSPSRLIEWETGSSAPTSEERSRLEAALASSRTGSQIARRAPRRLVWLDERGVAWVDDTNRKVREIAVERTALGWTPEEIQEQHPDLTIAQIYAALTYYYDHQDLVDAELAEEDRLVEALRRGMEEPPIVQRLREAKRAR